MIDPLVTEQVTKPVKKYDSQESRQKENMLYQKWLGGGDGEEQMFTILLISESIPAKAESIDDTSSGTTGV